MARNITLLHSRSKDFPSVADPGRMLHTSHYSSWYSSGLFHVSDDISSLCNGYWWNQSRKGNFLIYISLPPSCIRSMWAVVSCRRPKATEYLRFLDLHFCYCFPNVLVKRIVNLLVLNRRDFTNSILTSSRLDSSIFILVLAPDFFLYYSVYALCVYAVFHSGYMRHANSN